MGPFVRLGLAESLFDHFWISRGHRREALQTQDAAEYGRTVRAGVRHHDRSSQERAGLIGREEHLLHDFGAERDFLFDRQIEIRR